MGDFKDPQFQGPPPPSYHAATSNQHVTAPPAQKTSAVPPRAYEIHSPAFSRALVFKDPASQETLYYVSTSSLTPGTPDLVLHAGDSKTGAVLGACRFHTFKPDELTLGDPAAAAATARHEDAHHSHGRYDFTADAGDGAGRRSFTWERTRSGADGVHGIQKLSGTNYVLADRQSGQQLAVHLARGLCSWGSQGVLELKAPLPPVLETWVLLTVASLVVRAIRKSNAAAASGGGGGGGAC